MEAAAEVVVSLSFKGKTEPVTVAADGTTDVLFAAAVALTGADAPKLIFKGKQLSPGQRLSETTLHGAKAPKLMVMATGAKAIADVLSAKSDPTVRGFAAEDEAARRLKEGSAELSDWANAQHAEYKFCRLEPCTWQSFGTRPSEKTPHAFAARQLLLRLAQDPAIIAIMVQRRWTVGVLGEMDPLDDRLAEKMEGGGKRLLGYNMNAGSQIHLRLRDHDLSGFLPYHALIDTLLHELSHNEHGPHDDQFWHLFCQLKADYLRHHLALAATGRVFSGKSPLQLAEASEQARDVRAATLGALERDRQAGPPSALQVGLLDAYLAATAPAFGAGGSAVGGGQPAAGRVLGGAIAAGGAGGGPAPSREEMRALLAARAVARQGNSGTDGPRESASQDEGHAHEGGAE